MTTIDYDKLAEKIALNMSRQVLSFSELSNFPGYSDNSASVRKLVADPSFPKPTTLTENGRPRWFRKDVDAWLEAKHHEKSRMAIGSKLQFG